MKGEAINLKTTQKAVNKLRLDVATALLRETGVLFFWLIVVNLQALGNACPLIQMRAYSQ